MVLNTVGPFAKFGIEVVQACLAAKCHYTDTTGEQDWLITLEQEFGTKFGNAGLLLAPLTTQPWHLYVTIGVLVGSGSVCLGYSGQSLYLPNWFVKRRGLAVGIAFAGVGLGSITLLPAVQLVIDQAGWRSASTMMGILLLAVLAPLNLLLRALRP